MQVDLWLLWTCYSLILHKDSLPIVNAAAIIEQDL